MPSRSPRDININVSVTNRKAADNPLAACAKGICFCRQLDCLRRGNAHANQAHVLLARATGGDGVWCIARAMTGNYVAVGPLDAFLIERTRNDGNTQRSVMLVLQT